MATKKKATTPMTQGLAMTLPKAWPVSAAPTPRAV